MYSYISGLLRAKTAQAAIIDNNGIGYRIFTAQRALEPLRLEDTVKFYTYLLVREDELSLYGFPEMEALALFEMLLTVTGIGPKAALNICGAGSSAEIYGAIVTGDVGWLTKVQGIGKKTAERLILELKEKIARNMGDGGGFMLSTGAQPLSTSGALGQALGALLSLGYQEHEVDKHLKQARALFGAEATVEELLKAVLRTMAEGR
ncbi:MAG: Holliday junction branch migration protein RuvA [Firmicutes bacterium]|nr:Holliday junction branch migration protein RuvA [Dethiobacter sp.]MBS3887919.1 Holliday junction branch migration protein RuvA [Bacillota bacterium]MBS4054241.1 Holliday junction branch migration protein RuvA [Thermaerobacter sp.]